MNALTTSNVVSIFLLCGLAGFQWLGISSRPDILLCSDGRCGQSSRSIRAENLHQQEATATKLTAAAAAADLNAYFDSLPTGSRESKVRTLEQTVRTLTGEVKSLKQPLSDMREASHQTAHAVSALRDQQAKLMADDAHHQRDVEQAVAHAAAAAADAAKADAAAEAAARRKTSVVLASIRPKTAARAVNPLVKVLGLPPGWKSYMDLRTKYTYFYNPRTRESTWESPAGAPESIVGLPDGWRAYKAKGGKLYYVNRKQAVSTWDDPRLLPGAKVLSLLDSMDQVNAPVCGAWSAQFSPRARAVCVWRGAWSAEFSPRARDSRYVLGCEARLFVCA